MTSRSQYDAVVVGAGPNGLSAGITLAQAGCSVLLLEAADMVGGGLRSDELTLPGFVHDPCAAVLPLSLASPFFRTLPLERYGLEWIHSPVVLAHPLDDGSAVVLERSLDRTLEGLQGGGRLYGSLMRPLLADWDDFVQDLLSSKPIPRHSPLTFLRFGVPALLPGRGLANLLFKEAPGRALFAGLSGHSMLPLERLASGAYGIVLGALGHAVGWPLPKGGARSLSQALVEHLRSMGGEVQTGLRVERVEQLPDHKVALFDLAPRSFLQIMGDRLPAGYRRTLTHYRYGPGVCKVDYALDGPVPWKSERASQAATLHLGGTLEEIAEAERQVARGLHPQRPYVLIAQQSLFDPTRAPQGLHTLWAYCHVPHGSGEDVSASIENQIERFAPGFKKRILGRFVRTAQQMEAYNPNYVGGDINSGVQDLFQLYTRPAPRWNPYATPVKNVFLCSSATPPGGGVHGMCGYFSAQSALRTLEQ